MADAPLPLNVGTGPNNAATWQDSVGNFHDKVVLEWLPDGAPDPLKVSASNPLPIAYQAAAYNPTPPTFSAATRVDLQTDANGRLLVNVAAGNSLGGTAATVGQPYPALVTPVGFQSASGNLLLPGNLDAVGNIMVNVAAGSVQAVTDSASAFTAGQTQGLALTLAVNDSAAAVPAGQMGIARMTAARQIRVVVDAAPSGGLTPFQFLAVNTVETVKASAGQIGFMQVINTNAAPVYLKFYDTASSVTLGTTAASFQFGVPGNTGGAGYTVPIPQ